jgi:dipeptidyl aminopeptidase/acylaminoacyl peptidase
LTRQRLLILGLVWTRDGRSIVYGTEGGLWSVCADGGAPFERVELASRGRFPSTLGSRDRLAFMQKTDDADIYRLDLGGSPAPLVDSTFYEHHPQYSPNGRRITFESNPMLQGAEIWLAKIDGSNPTRLTRGPGRSQGSPSWSPDGQVIVFDSQAQNGHADVWTIGVSGSGLRQITHDPADDVVPSFSRDGRFVYFTSNRTGRNETWRVPAEGGAEEQVTHESSAMAFESFDGRTLYYQWGINGALLSRPTVGEEERTIRPCVFTLAWAVAPQGLIHEDCSAPGVSGSRQRNLRYWDAATGQDRQVATLDIDMIQGFSVPRWPEIAHGRPSTSDHDDRELPLSAMSPPERRSGRTTHSPRGRRRGMGEVYRARDHSPQPRGRDQVLPAERLSDLTRRARFVL